VFEAVSAGKRRQEMPLCDRILPRIADDRLSSAAGVVPRKPFGLPFVPHNGKAGHGT
jgi:hypothetical protein